MASPNMLATTFRFKAERYQTIKFALAWLAMISTTFVILPLVSFRVLPVSIAIATIFFLMMAQLFAIIY